MPRGTGDTVDLPVGGGIGASSNSSTTEAAALRFPDGPLRPMLQVTAGPAAGRTLRLPVGETVLGRDGGCTLVLDDPSVSRRHAVVRVRADGKSTLSDLGSSNGTWLRGGRLGSAVLADGDRFRLGREAVLRFVLAEPAEEDTLDSLYRAATRDELTGCLNRRASSEALRGLAAEALRTGRPAGVLLVDVDRFKALNDLYGHTPAGDDVLRSVAAAMRAAVPAGAEVGRWGGEEFVVLLPGADQQAAAEAAEAVRAAVQGLSVETRDLFERPVRLAVTVSAGAAACPPDVRVQPVPADEPPTAGATGSGKGGAGAPGAGGETAARPPADPQRVAALRLSDELLRTADRRLLAAKRGGRNRVVAVELPSQSPSYDTVVIEPASRLRVGEILIRRGVVTESDIREAVRRQNADAGGRSLGEILLAMGACRAEDILSALNEQVRRGDGESMT